MIKSYFTSAIRFLLNNKAYTLLNLSGLIVGISFSCMLYTYVKYELSFDDYHGKAARTVRVMTRVATNAGAPELYNVAVPPLGPEMVKSFPEVETMTRLFRSWGR